MSGYYDHEELFWDNFGDNWWNEERRTLCPERYHGLTHNQQVLVNAASVAHLGGNPRCYPCDEEDVGEVARTPTPKPPLRKVPIRRAGDDIIHYNCEPRRLSPSERESMHRLRLKLFDPVSFRIEDLPGLVIRAFKDLDRMLFGSSLFGRVHVRWAGPSAMIEAYPENDSANTRLRGLSTSRSWGSRIDLCIEGLLITRDGGEDVFAILDSVLVTLLHEMVHAYFYIRCSEYDIPDGHDNSFWCVLEAVAIHIEEEFGFSALRQHFDESYEDVVQGRR